MAGLHRGPRADARIARPKDDGGHENDFPAHRRRLRHDPYQQLARASRGRRHNEREAVAHPERLFAARPGDQLWRHGRTIFIVEQSGRIKRATFSDDSWKKLGTFLDLSSKVNDHTKSDNFERGLLGLAFHPNYASNGRFYVDYTRRGSGGNHGDTVVAEYRRDTTSKAKAGSARIVMVFDQPAANHDGGHLAFGPDGLLYISTGDGGGSGDPNRNGQKKTTRVGKVLRIDPIDPDGSGPKKYRTPGSNPRVGKSGNNDIWAWGLRNPWRFSFDRCNGDLWIGDVGQRT
jgi:glucose/arabinose dehydrogenase